MNQWNQPIEEVSTRIVDLSGKLNKHLLLCDSVIKKKLALKVLEQLETIKSLKLSDRLHDFLLDTLLIYQGYYKDYLHDTHVPKDKIMTAIFSDIQKYLAYFPEVKAGVEESRVYPMIRDAMSRLSLGEDNPFDQVILERFAELGYTTNVREAIEKIAIDYYRYYLEDIKQTYQVLIISISDEVGLVKQSKYYKILLLQIRYLERVLKLLAQTNMDSSANEKMTMQLLELYEQSIHFKEAVESAALSEQSSGEWHEKNYLSIIIKEVNRLDYSEIQQIMMLIAKEKEYMITETNRSSKKVLSYFNRETDRFAKLLNETIQLIKRLDETECEMIANEEDKTGKIIISIYQAMVMKLRTMEDNFELLVTQRLVDQKKLEKILLEHKRQIYQMTENMALDYLTNVAADKDKVFVRIEKMHREAQMKCLGIIIGYYREYLISDLQSYDEIIKGSMDKVRDYEAGQLKQWLETFEETYEAIQQLLKRYKIVTISPKPKTLFDSKRQNVLSAEEKKGYKKGEIIDTYQVGYEWNEQVIVRANVICCK